MIPGQPVSSNRSIGGNGSLSQFVPLYFRSISSISSRRLSSFSLSSRSCLSSSWRHISGNERRQYPSRKRPMQPTITRKPCHTAVSTPLPPCSPLHSEPPSQMLIHISIISRPRLSSPLLFFRDIVSFSFLSFRLTKSRFVYFSSTVTGFPQ